MSIQVVRIMRSVLIAIAALSGLALCGGGFYLLSLGGSPFYLVFGLAFLLIATLLHLWPSWALWVYAALILITGLWSVSEVGLDWWQLMPRGAYIVTFGAVVLLCGCVIPRSLDAERGILKSGRIALGLSILVSAGVAFLAIMTPTHELTGSLEARVAPASSLAAPAGADWMAYGGTQAGQRYSTLDQITPTTVDQLKVAWTFHTGDVRRNSDPVETTYEVTPLKIGNTVYLCTPHDLVFALDAETGAQRWRYDPAIKQPPRESTQHLTCRGVSYFDGTSLNLAASTSAATPSPECVKRLFLPTVDGRLIALSADTGKVCPGFGGPQGVDLWRNMPNVKPGSYYSTSPPVIANELIIVGGAVNDNVSTSETSGVVRAFDVHTGALIWNWDSEKPDETKPIGPNSIYAANSPNSWSVSSYDPKLGLIFIPMGNRPPDQFGGDRDENAETYSSSIVALRAATGAVEWVFQSTHHDLWDMDVPAQPVLVDLSIKGETIPSLVETTKQGELFVLDRRTGKPVLPVTEMPTPQGAAKGDRSAPTQPVSAISFNPPPLTEASMWGISPFDQLACRIAFRSLRYEGRYTPPSLQGSLIYPGNFGTFNWGSVAVDPERQIVFAMPVYLAFTSTLKTRSNPTERLVTKPGEPPFNENFGAPYATKLGAFLSPLGLPCQAPPWGYVAGVDLTTGKITYQHINGTVRDLSPIPLPFKMGVPGIGGPILTKGGVAFLSGTLDYYLRAYDATTGKQLWESRLPAGGQATPMTYWSEASHRQFVIVVAGGHGSTGTKAGDSIIAYAIPK